MTSPFLEFMRCLSILEEESVALFRKTVQFLVVSLLLTVAILYLTAEPGKSLADTNVLNNDIIMVTVDTLRADHLSPYGHPYARTPFFQEVASKGVLFENAYSSISTTTPSISSLMTSLHPTVHGDTRNGLILPEHLPTLAGYLKQHGYETVAIVATNHFIKAGITKDFEVAIEPGSSSDFQANSPERKYIEAEHLTKKAIQLIGESRAEKLFVWVHYFDPHLPYDVPGPDANALKHDLERRVQQYREDPSFFSGRGLSDSFWKQFPPQDARLKEFMTFTGNVITDRATVISLYDQEITRVDAAISTLHSGVLASRNGAFWIFAADHGESLGSHNWYPHGKLINYQLVHVPLILYSDNNDLEAKRVARPVQLVDVFPTTVDLIEKELNSGELPMSNGFSLIPLMFAGS